MVQIIAERTERWSEWPFVISGQTAQTMIVVQKPGKKNFIRRV